MPASTRWPGLLRTVAAMLSAPLLLLVVAEHGRCQSQPPAADPAGKLVEDAGKLAEAHRLSEAEAAYLEALRTYEKQARETPANLGLQVQECACRNRLGMLLTSMEKYSAARDVLSANLAILHRLSAEHPQEPAFR